MCRGACRCSREHSRWVDAAVRWLARTLARRHRKNDTRRRKVVVLGAVRTGQNLARQMQLDENAV